MPSSTFCRTPSSATRPAGARAGAAAAPARVRRAPSPAFQQSDLDAVARYMVPLMMRNVASAGHVLSDPAHPERSSRPGCIVAAPSYPADLPGDEQDYVFNWVRDSAIVAVEIAEAGLPRDRGGAVTALRDYVEFAHLCQEHAAPTPAHACFTIDGWPRPWSEQSDGPALQTVACLRIHDQLDTAGQALAREVIGRNLSYLMTAYREPTHNLWEEHDGLSFFARSAQLRCFEEVAANTIGIDVPDGLDEARRWLGEALERHWNGTHYVSLAQPPSGDPGTALRSAVPDYDPNIDIVCAAVYGQASSTDTRLLATAAQLRRQWADPASPTFYPINGDDHGRGIGPLLGRYPGDRYDGDLVDAEIGGHPWALGTCNFAELYYRVAADLAQGGTLPLDELSADFFGDVGVTAATPSEAAVAALRSAGDAMLRAVIYHSDNYELSEQFDGTTGYEKSLRNLSWSYAAFISAVRSRQQTS